MGIQRTGQSATPKFLWLPLQKLSIWVSLQQYIAGLTPFDFCLQEVTTQEGFYIVLHYWCTAAVDAEWSST